MKTQILKLKDEINDLKIQAIERLKPAYVGTFEVKRANIQRGKAIAYENVESLIDDILKKIDGKENNC